MALALFDLDNTLLDGDSDYLWGQFLIEQKLVDKEYYQTENHRFLDLYHQGRLDIYEFAEFAFRPLAENDLDKLTQLHQQFMREKICPIITDKSRALVEKHKSEGDTLIIITATNSFVTAPIAKAFGIEHLIATEPETKNGRFTGKIAGTPCFQEGKVTRLKNWLLEQNIKFENCVFYSDSNNDLPLLKMVKNPVAVDPDEKLKAIAEENNWPVMSLR
ncbi:MAG: HAD family hydrolase [Gammaproteobacteria bacterium]|nr:HAD family hydrolase [Gammaproteobacteria bacterium]